MCVCIINRAIASVHKPLRRVRLALACSTYCVIVVFTHLAAGHRFNLCISLSHGSLPQLCIFQSLSWRYGRFASLIWGWGCPDPAWCCCSGPSSWPWCSCCAARLPGRSHSRAPAARRPIGSVCAPVCCECCPSGSWGPVGRRWCAAGGSSSLGSHCWHPRRSCLYAGPCVHCWTWRVGSGGCTPAGTNGPHIPLWWTVRRRRHYLLTLLLITWF